MKAATEEFLIALLYAAGRMMRPSWHDFDSSYESWVWRNGFGQRLAHLEKEKLLERRRKEDGTGWLYRLTEAGQTAALGGRNPEHYWGRKWDGQWRLVLFDLPQRERQLRVQVWRWLRANSFGYLQNSLWITPILETASRLSPAASPNVGSWIVFLAKAEGGITDKTLVQASWDFDEINQRYSRYLEHLQKLPTQQGTPAERLGSFRRWLRNERILWREAFSRDPLLPNSLLPRGYLGRRAWQKQRQVWAQLRNRVRKDVQAGASAP